MESCNYDPNMMDWVCRWALLAERLKATEDKIRKIESGKINADRLLEQAQIFRGESGGERTVREPAEMRSAASLPVMRPYAADLIRQKREREQQAEREKRERETAAQKTGPYRGYKAAPIYPAIPIPVSPEDEDSIRKKLIEESLEQGDLETAEIITTESPEALGERWLRYITGRNARKKAAAPAAPPGGSGPADDVRRKLREQRKKKKKK